MEVGLLYFNQKPVYLENSTNPDSNLFRSGIISRNCNIANQFWVSLPNTNYSLLSPMEKTRQQFKEIIDKCQSLFEKKTKDYGTAWRILRLPSITDQIYIKAQRIRSIQEKGKQKIADGIEGEFIGIINYCIMALIQIEYAQDERMELPTEETVQAYHKHIEETVNLMLNKNHDYGEAWRNMRVPSMTDIILMKLLRVKQIEDNQGETLVSEGVEANYQDMINYAIFCLILMSEEK